LTVQYEWSAALRRGSGCTSRSPDARPGAAGPIAPSSAHPEDGGARFGFSGKNGG